MTDRLNARIDADLARKLEYLQRRTGASVTGVVKASIERYYEELRSAASPADVLERVGFVGCAEGPTDLARTYKDRLGEGLRNKVGR